MSDLQPGRDPATTYNLLFVCTGNTCRSPMAEAIARSLVQQRGWQHVAVVSAGTGAIPGVAASAEAVDVAREHDIDLAAHASQPVTPALIDWADLVLVMGPTHMHVVAELGGAAKVAFITDFIEGEGGGNTIADPFGGDHDSYRVTFAQLETAVSALIDRLEPILAP